MKTRQEEQPQRGEQPQREALPRQEELLLPPEGPLQLEALLLLVVLPPGALQEALLQLARQGRARRLRCPGQFGPRPLLPQRCHLYFVWWPGSLWHNPRPGSRFVCAMVSHACRRLSKCAQSLNLCGDEDDLRVDDHDLAFLAVWPGCTIQEHRIGVGDDQVECANLLRPILKWNVS